jgi:hypothetical protein
MNNVTGMQNKMTIPQPTPKTNAAPHAAQNSGARHVDSARSKFDQKLEQAAKRAESKTEGTDAEEAEDVSERSDDGQRVQGSGNGKQNKKLNEEFFIDGNMFATTPNDLRAVQAGAEVTGPRQADEAHMAHIDRMAAAIAEAVQKGNQSVFTVDFGKGAMLAQSAIITRDAAGMVSINFVTPNSSISPPAWQVLRNQLSDKLRDRKVALKEITVHEKAGAQSQG